MIGYDKFWRKNPILVTTKIQLMEGMDKLFDIFCVDRVQRRTLEVKHQLTEKDYEFYHDQNDYHLGKCLIFMNISQTYLI